MPTFQHDDITFRYHDEGSGVPFVMQHGLGGCLEHMLDLARPAPQGMRLICMDFRAHGQTTPMGPEDKLAISTFADDVAALLDHLDIDRAIVGGVSMGAATALNFAVRKPERVLGLVLCRPAWLDEKMPPNLKLCPIIADLVRRHGRSKGKALFEHHPEYQAMCARSPHDAASLLGQFDDPSGEPVLARLERIPADRPIESLDLAKRLTVPTLVIGTDQDEVHPIAYAKTIAQTIPGAHYEQAATKALDPQQYTADVHRIVSDFVRRVGARMTR